ncbi:unnamed protein product [Brassica napus]|uniref:(rape) hypothetical protein n=2 Tax=Brassica napus TaxID=3708 RepID=A0A816JY93_BRANA|nr:unnamed protein product [Brassica napus]
MGESRSVALKAVEETRTEKLLLIWIQSFDFYQRSDRWLNLYERWLSAMPDIQKLERSLFCLFNICPGTSSSSIKERLIHCIAINNYLKFTMQWEALALLLIGISVNQLCSLPEGSHVDVRQRNKCHGWTSGYGRLSFNAKPSLNAENWHLVIVVSGILLT